MSGSAGKPEPGSKSEAVSSFVDAIGGMAGLAVAAVSITREQFIKHAVVANLHELEAARIALRRAQRSEVQEAARGGVA